MSSKGLILALAAALTVLPCAAQSVQELQKRKQQAEETLKMTSGLISETQADTKKTLSRVNLLKAEIRERQTIIKSLNAEVNQINRQLSQLRAEVAQKQKELDLLRQEYAKLVYHRYYSRSDYQALMFILSADGFAESYRRYRYMKQYAEYCELKVREIEEVKAGLEANMQEIEQKRAERAGLLKDRRTENSKLQSEKSKQDRMVRQLRSKEKELRAELRRQQKIADELNDKIERMIAAEAGGSKGGKKDSGKYKLTKEEQLVSGDFEKNQGRLPWPVEKGIVVGKFGLQPHPVWDHVTTNNKGIYIQCPAGSNARAVFDGEVTQCFSIPGSNNAVIIKHGIYRTVYANLSKITVKAGDKVKAKQSIGRIYSDPENDDRTELYFQVWKDRAIHNPENWLAK